MSKTLSGAVPLLEIQNTDVAYRTSFRQKKTVVRGVNLSLMPGQSLGLVGESGSGKTTLTQAILGRIPVESGSIRVDGVEVEHKRSFFRNNANPKVQMVFQNPMNSLNPHRTIWASMQEPMKHLTVDEPYERAVGALERVGIEPEALLRFPAAFSGGQRQRICIARAIIAEPSLLICDEPVSALDLSVQRQVLDLLNSLREELDLSIFIISHDLDAVRYTTDNLAVMYRGEIQEYGATELIIENPNNWYTQKLMESTLIPDPNRQRAKRDRLVDTTRKGV